jgi:hypothetical protein
VAGELSLSIDLAHLIDNPALRWGYSWEAANRYHIDDLRPGDVEALRARMDKIGYDGWWSLSERLMEAAPARATVVRDANQHPVGFTVVVTPGNAPEMAWLDPQLGSWLRHAEQVLRTREVVIWQASVNLTGDQDSPVQAMLGMSGILRSGLPNPRYGFLPINPRLAGGVAFAAATGAQRVPDLDVEVPDGRIECYVLDFGPGGVLGYQRDDVYTETGTTPPTQDPDLLAAAVRYSLRHLHRPSELASSPLAVGSTPIERAASVRTLLTNAIDETFGTTPDERLLRDVLVRGCLDPVTTHEQAADDLHVSRATYFRKLRTATERLSRHVASSYA